MALTRESYHDYKVGTGRCGLRNLCSPGVSGNLKSRSPRESVTGRLAPTPRLGLFADAYPPSRGVLVGLFIIRRSCKSRLFRTEEKPATCLLLCDIGEVL